MNVMMHYPNNVKNMLELKKRIAEIHAQAVIQNIQSLSCPKEQKLELIKEIKQSFRE